MNIQEMKEKKKEKGYTNEQIAELSGVPLGTVQKIFGGTTTSPRYDTLKALEKIFLPMERYSALWPLRPCADGTVLCICCKGCKCSIYSEATRRVYGRRLLRSSR